MVLNKDRSHEEWLFLIFQQLCRKPEELCESTGRFLYEFQETRVRTEIPATKPVVIRDLWRCPLTGKLELNADASVNSGLGCIEVGAVVRNDDEDIVLDVLSKAVPIFQRLYVTELLATREALKWCQDI
ncbi:hypothetical protein PanWU01x14_174270 [Parasponia andersonii]|uniref:RNase H type-1 domain-containing protein n=1 Tax=Parasponia andersonii TaxID=3476 RepID=A0A2P5C8B0_PARAD|nr:hypothetical protein PanWU01x14_174270 [Parasponia andersonii]